MSYWRYSIKSIGVGLCMSVCTLVLSAEADDGPAPASVATKSKKMSRQKSLEPKVQETAAPTEKPAEEPQDAVDESDDNDPLEGLNRVLYAVGGVIDTVIFRPFAFIYREAIPDPIQKGVENVIDNLLSPVVFANHLLQGEPERAFITLGRTIVNSTMGLGGLLDAGSEIGLEKHDTNFAETLMVWGVDSGPYIYLPLLGGTTFRGLVGLTGDYYMNPVNWYFNNKSHRKHRGWLYVRDTADALNRRAKVIDLIDDLSKSSPDLYVTLRSVHFQHLKYRKEVLNHHPDPDDAATSSFKTDSRHKPKPFNPKVKKVETKTEEILAKTDFQMRE